MPKKEPDLFEGFSKETVNFYKELEQNNSKKWFDKNRDIYEREVKARAESFVVAMGGKVKRTFPNR